MDIYDGTDWTEMDIEDLKAAIAHGRSIEEVAEFLCRAGSPNDVARKCRELELKTPKKTLQREPAPGSTFIRTMK